jgi:hypothetical protein
MGDIRFSSPLYSFVSFVVKVLGFPITAMSGDLGDRRATRATSLCLRPSASDPTPPPPALF